MIFRKRPRLPDQETLERELAELVRTDLLTEHDDVSAADANLLEALDSIRILRLCALVEDRYGVKIADDELTTENFAGCDALASFLRSKS